MRFGLPAILSSLLLLSACATTPIPISKAIETPAERRFYTTPSGGPFATATFIRDTGLFASGVYQHLSINDEKAADLDVGEKVSFRLRAGEYVFSVVPTDPFGANAPYAIDQKLEAGKSYYYRILVDGQTYGTRLQRIINNSTEQPARE